jgi:hypothetical protein
MSTTSFNVRPIMIFSGNSILYIVANDPFVKASTYLSINKGF